MQKNNFEKQIREQLEELHFRPSAPVWENVAADIKAKRRRRIIAYLFTSLLLLSGALFITYYTTRSGTDDQLAQKNKSIEKAEEASSGPNSSGKKLPSDTKAPESVVRAENEPPGNVLTPSAQEAPITGTISNRNSQKISSPAKSRSFEPKNIQNQPEDKPRKYSNDSKQVQTTIEPTIAARPLADVNLPSGFNAETGLDEMSDPGKQATANTSLNPASGTVSPNALAGRDHPSMETISDPAFHNVPSAVSHPEAARSQIKNNKWEWGVEAGLGLGFRRDGALPGISTKKTDRVDLMQGSAVVGPAFGFAVLRYFPSASDEALGFSVGVNGRYPISPSLKFTAGLRYSYQSEQIRVGKAYDSMLVFNNYLAQRVTTNHTYVGPQNNSFRNQYHFLQIPIGLELKLNKGRKTPISWEIGMAPGLLLGTQALVYDTAFNGIYYKDKAQFNRFQLTASSGFSIELRNKKGMRFVLGPELRSNLTALAENGYDNRQYLFYGGLRARVFLAR